MYCVAVDIGGTKIAAARIRRGDVPAVIENVTLPTLASAGFDCSLSQVFQAIDRCLTEDVRAIGICAPGPLNPKTGIVLNPPNLPGWSNVPLAQLVSERYGRPCRVENDANAAGLAETMFGAAQGCASVVYVTLSTGIGTGVILNGRVYHGKNGAAGEGGHVSIAYNGPVCNCGARGCVEALASGKAWKERGVDPAHLSEANLDELARIVSAWLGGIVSLLDPDIIVIGGGMSQIGEPLFRRLRTLVPACTINQFAGETPIVPAKLASHVGLFGAASVVFSLESDAFLT